MFRNERLSHRVWYVIGTLAFAFFGMMQPVIGQESEAGPQQATPPVTEPEQKAPEPRQPDVVLAEIEAIEYPLLDQSRAGDREYMQEYKTQVGEANLQKAVLIHELYKSDPMHEKTIELMPVRWDLLYKGAGAGALQREVQEVIDTMPDSPLVKPATHWKDFIDMRLVFEGQNVKQSEFVTAAEGFAKKYPDDERAAPYLIKAARWAYVTGTDEWLEAHRRIGMQYPETKAGIRSAGKVRWIEAVGKPFELTFPNALTQEHETINIEQYHGKVVVVHFWATWIRNCEVVENEMKAMYEKYHGRGLEIIGVSLDMSPKQGGLTRLLRFVKNHEMPWPQYYQGNGWSGEFSSYWGIDGAPWSFVIDAGGKLHTAIPGEDLENIVRELLGMAPLPPVVEESTENNSENG